MLRIILTAFTIVALQTNLCPAAKRPASSDEEDTVQPAPKRAMSAVPRLRHAIVSAQISEQQRGLAHVVLQGLQRDRATDEAMTATIEALLAGFIHPQPPILPPAPAVRPLPLAPVVIPPLVLPPAPRAVPREIPLQPAPRPTADDVLHPMPVRVMRLVEEDITPDTLHAMIDAVDPMFFGRAGSEAEHAWVNEQMADGENLRGIRETLALRLQTLAEGHLEHLADNVEAQVLELPRRGATRNGWFARNAIAAEKICSICQVPVNTLDVRTQIVKLPCDHVVCKACCIQDFASYPDKTTTIPGEANDADEVVKAAIESGALDPDDLDQNDLARILGGSEDAEVADEAALALHGANQYKCPECHAICAMVAE